MDRHRPIATRTEQLDALFDRWTAALSVDERPHFFRDGINDEVGFERAPLRLLFIAAEPNAVRSDSWGVSRRNDLRVLTRETAARNHFGMFGSSLARWTALLLDGVPVGIPVNAGAQLLRIAMVNLKKIGGVERAWTRDVESWTFANRDFFLEQVAIIDPHIIVACGGHVRTVLPRVLTGDPAASRLDSSTVWQGIRVIPSLHPSARGASSAKDAFLERQATKADLCSLRRPSPTQVFQSCGPLPGNGCRMERPTLRIRLWRRLLSLLKRPPRQAT